MVPTAEQVMDRRHRMVQWLRRLILILLILGSMPLTVWAINSLREPDFAFWSLSEFLDQFEFAAMFWLPAVILLLLDRRLVKWVVPLPKAVCPRCEHSLQQITEPRCPECGCPVPPSFVDRLTPVVNATGA